MDKFSTCQTQSERIAFLEAFHRTVLHLWYKDAEFVDQICEKVPSDVAVKNLFQKEVKDAYNDVNYHSVEICKLQDLWESSH